LSKALARLPMPNGQLPRAPEGLRLYVIGDVHGCLDKLLSLELQIEIDARSANGDVRIVMLGDYVDRGPHSREVLNHIIQSQKSDGRMALCGNHDFYLPYTRTHENEIVHWCRYGGIDTLFSYGIDIRRWDEGQIRTGTAKLCADFQRLAPPEHRAFIDAMPRHVRFGDYLFVHAGLQPGLPLEKQKRRELLTIREPFLSSDADHGAVVVHGHTVSEQVDVRNNRIGIDTGAAYGGKLTALVLEGEERWLLQA
jgi:serine/threonine protein phosphatase 1